MTGPALRFLSLGAGVQSTTLLLMSAFGELPKADAAIFADTGWEPARVYEHLDKITAVAAAADIPVIRVSNGNLRDDATAPDRRYTSLPFFIKHPPGPCRACSGTGRDTTAGWVATADLFGDDSTPPPCPVCRGTGQDNGTGMGRRQCTHQYKLEPVNRKIRELLGATPPQFLRVPRGRQAEQWIGFSADEVGRINDRAPSYLTMTYPLMDLGMDRRACERWLIRHGWTSVAKSACIGCPYNGNRAWRDLRDNRPEEWQDAVAFDRAIRNGHDHGADFTGEAFLHRSHLPLDQAPIDIVTPKERLDLHPDLLGAIEDGDPDGCSPYGCRSGEVVA